MARLAKLGNRSGGLAKFVLVPTMRPSILFLGMKRGHRLIEMKNHQVRKAEIPRNSLILEALKPIDHADAFAIRLNETVPCDVDRLFKALLRSRPGWVAVLMRLRDRIVSRVGLKTSDDKERNVSVKQLPMPLQVGQKIGIFRIYEVAENEIVFGEDDRHLDFRSSLICLSEANLKVVTLATVVKFNNIYGRIYFLLIMPFHKAVVTAMLENLDMSGIKN